MFARDENWNPLTARLALPEISPARSMMIGENTYVADHPYYHSGLGTVGEFASVAVQRELGLLSERRAGTPSPDHHSVGTRG